MPRLRRAVNKSTEAETSPDDITDVHSAYCHMHCVKRRNYVPLLIAGLLMTTFLLGMAFMKIQYLQNTQVASGSTAGANPTGTKGPPVMTHFDAYAKQVGLDSDKFDKCVASGKYVKTVQDDTAAGTKAGVNGTPTMYVNGLPIEGAQPYDSIKATIDQELSSSRRLNKNVNDEFSLMNLLAGQAYAQTITDTNTPTPPARVSLENGHLPMLGSSNAKVIIVEFSDFQCPFCKQLEDQSFGNIKKTYIDTGKVKFYYRQFPLPFHPNAMGAATAAECANEQGKFWQFHDVLFANQASWQNDTPITLKQ